MCAQLPPDDLPPDQWRRFTSDAEAQTALPQPSPDNPVSVSLMFCEALEQPAQFLTALRALTTPESHDAWGDFEATGAFLRSIPDRGYGSVANPAHDAPDVCYFKILGGVVQSYEVLDDQVVEAAAILTLVWRPEYGSWLVHSIGIPLRPDDVPRTA